MALVANYAHYTADSIYASVPQFIQDQDLARSTDGLHGPLYYYISGIADIIDKQVNILARDNMGAGVGGVGADGTVDTKNYFGALGWSQAIDIDRCPEYALPWLAQFVGVHLDSPNSMAYADQITKIKERTSFKRGTIPVLLSAIAAIVTLTSPTPLLTSQIVAMENTKYVGTTIAASGNITQSAGVATFTAVSPHGLVTGQIVSIINGSVAGLNLAHVPVTVTSSTAFTYAAATAGPSSGASVVIEQFLFDRGSITILLPISDFSLQIYEALNGGGSATYASLAATYATYGAISGTPTPITSNNYNNIIYRYRPAGMQIYIGGY